MRLNFCALCGEKDQSALEHHHFIPRVMGGSDDETNMFTVCGTCHGKIHDVPRPHRLSVLIKEAHKQRKEERQQKLEHATKQREARLVAASAYENLDIPEFLLRCRKVHLTAYCRLAIRPLHFAEQEYRQELQQAA
jgi:HNH endonuclease